MSHMIPAMLSELTYDNLRLHYVYQVSIYAVYELFKKVDLNNLDKNKTGVIQSALRGLEYEIEVKTKKVVHMTYDESIWFPTKENYGKTLTIDIDNENAQLNHVVFELDLTKDAFTGVCIGSSNKGRAPVNAFDVQFIPRA
jgi:hypothetical protein